MLRKIESFFTSMMGDEAPTEGLSENEIAIASAALLVKCANADGKRTPEEDAKLVEVITKGLELSAEEAESVIEFAEVRARDALDIHQFTKRLHANLDREERQRMVGWLWEMAQVDGRIDSDEQNTVTLIARLLDVEVRDSAELRQNAKRSFKTKG
ncbi:MAG: TerB family tellurite resistance protein [Pseudomonadota bacterium]